MEKSGREPRTSSCVREKREQVQNWLKTWGHGQGLRGWANQGGMCAPNSSTPRAWVHNLIFLSSHAIISLREAFSHLPTPMSCSGEPGLPAAHNRYLLSLSLTHKAIKGGVYMPPFSRLGTEHTALQGLRMFVKHP